RPPRLRFARLPPNFSAIPKVSNYLYDFWHELDFLSPSVSHHLGNMAASTAWLAGRKAAANGSLRCRGYLQNCFLQFLHINRFGEMCRKAGPAASLHVLLHPITADGDAFGIADL